MDEQTQPASQPEDNATETPETPQAEEQAEEEATTGTGGGSSGSSEDDYTVDETDWPWVAELIAREIEKKQPTYQTIPAKVFGEEVELRIVDQVTVGNLLVSGLLVVAIFFFLLRWLFKAIWGR